MKQTFTPQWRTFIVGLTVLFCLPSSFAQYCAADHSGSGGTPYITSITLNSLNYASSVAPASPYYTLVPATGANTTSLVAGLSYPITVNASASTICAVWIDFNQNSTFEPSEFVQPMTAAATGSATIVVPATASLGATRMRIRTRSSGSPNGSGDACTTFFSGEARDYTITIVGGSPCTNPVTGGTATASNASICQGSSSVISVAGMSFGTGITYQWYSSANNTTWTPITGANNTSYVASPTTPTYYHLGVICSGGTEGYSTSAQVGINTFVNCYCAASATNTVDEEILNVTMGTLNNSSTCTSVGTGATSVQSRYSDFTTGAGAPAAPVLNLGSTVAFSLGAGTCGTTNYDNGFAVWIDFNRNGIFDANENIYSSAALTSGAHTETGSFIVPVGASAGLTRMRVILNESSIPTDPCVNPGYGEVEDYLVNLQNSSACINPPNPGTAAAASTAVCPNIATNISVSGFSFGTGIVYQWYSSPNNTTWTAIAGANNPFYSASSTTDTYYRMETICSGGAPVYTNSVFITINSFINCYCSAAAAFTADEEVLGVSIGTLNNTSTCTSVGTGPTSIQSRYSDFTTGTGAPTPPALLKSVGYTLTLNAGTCGTSNYDNGFAVWIDYNQNGIFDASEKVYNSAALTSGAHTETANIVIPPGAVTGLTRMRVILSETNIPTAPCTNPSYGEVEDYLVNITIPSPCLNPVIAGETTANRTTICPSSTTAVNFNVNNASIGTGLTYQWQAAAAAGGPWTDITGETAYNYAANLTTGGFFRRAIICSGGTVDYSLPVQIITDLQVCYCSAAANFTFDEEIFNVTLGSLNNTSDCSTVATGTGSIGSRYSNYTNGTTAVAAPVLLPNSTQNISVQVGTCGTFDYDNGVSVWIDYNHDGSFNAANELVYTSPSLGFGAHIETGIFTIPTTALRGVTRMRVIASETTIPTNPCTNPNYGEVEDYLIDINCPNAGFSASGASVCSGGSVSVSATPYLAGATYSWTGNGTTASGQTAVFNNVTASGVYTVTASVAGGCSATATTSITVSAPMAMISTTNAACSAGNGIATVSGMSGIAPYTYAWSNASAGGTIITGAGTYTVTMTDNIGCSTTAQTVILQPNVLSSANTVIPVTCFGAATGMINTAVTGGTSPYTYAWSTSNGVGSMANNLTAGSYTLTISDANGCSIPYNFTVTEPAAIANTASITNETCFGGSTGMISVMATGGSGSFGYLWSNTATSSMIMNLTAGAYTVSITDLSAGTCSTVVNFTITEPTAIQPMATSMNVVCNTVNTGTAMVAPMGGTSPYTQVWSNAATSANISSLAPGNYTVTVTDGNSCTMSSSVTIAPSSAITIGTMATNATCFGSNSGSVMAMPSGGTAPFSYSWSHDFAITSGTASNLYAGTYYVFVNDAFGCSASSSAVVGQPATGLSVTSTATNQTATPANGAATVNFVGGVAPYSVLWSNGATTATISNLAAGSYCATVTDGNGCTQTVCATVSFLVETESTALFSEVIIFPNPTEGAFSLDLKMSQVSDVTLDVFGITGVAITSQKASNVTNRRFDFDLTMMPSGVYFVRIKADNETKVVRMVLAK